MVRTRSDNGSYDVRTRPLQQQIRGNEAGYLVPESKAELTFRFFLDSANYFPTLPRVA